MGVAPVALVRASGPMTMAAKQSAGGALEQFFPRVPEFAVGRAQHRLVLLVEIHVLLVGALELRSVEQDVGFGARFRAGHRDVDRVAEDAHPVKLLALGAGQVQTDGAARSSEPIEAVGVGRHRQIHAVAARFAGKDIIPTELAGELVRREGVAGKAYHLQVLENDVHGIRKKPWSWPLASTYKPVMAPLLLMASGMVSVELFGSKVA